MQVRRASSTTSCGLNDLDHDETNIFMDQQAFIDHFQERGYDNGIILLQGSVAELTDDECTSRHPVKDVRGFFAHKAEHLCAYRERQRPVIEREKASWRHPEIDVFAELRRRVEPLLRESTFLAGLVGGPVLLELVGDDSEPAETLLIDFDARQVRRYAHEAVCYQFTTKRTLVEHLHTAEVDWVNSLLLSCNVLTCQMHGWQFDLATGRCLTSPDHEIRAQRAN